MFKNKKAQSAVEYLMTYGWAILIIIVVGAALWKLGIFDPTKWGAGPQKLAIPGFTVADSKLTSASLTFVAGSTLAKSVTIDVFTATFGTQSAVNCTSGGVNIAGNTWSSGEQKTAVCTAGTALSGSSTVKVDYTYTDPDSSLPHSDSVTTTLEVES